jgi:hypothetical protein
MHTVRGADGRRYVYRDGHWVKVPTHILGYAAWGRRYLSDWYAWAMGLTKDEPILESYRPRMSSNLRGTAMSSTPYKGRGGSSRRPPTDVANHTHEDEPGND